MNNSSLHALHDLCIITLCLVFSLAISAQKDKVFSNLEMSSSEIESSQMVGHNRVSQKTNIPLHISGIASKVKEGRPEDQARAYIESVRNVMGWTMAELDTDLSLHAIRKGLSGHVVRFNQYYKGIPVYHGQIAIHVNNNNQVTQVANSWKYNIGDIHITPKTSNKKALSSAITRIGIVLPARHMTEEMIIYQNNGNTILAFRHTLSGQEYSGVWEIITNARTGQIVKAKNITYACKAPNHEHHKADINHTEISPMPFIVSGIGNVYDPDPLSSSESQYGDMGFTDDGDRDTPELAAEIKSVNLLDITDNGGTFELKGPYAEIVDHDAPFKGVFSQDNPDFSYNRTHDAFEAVNAYYHVDASMRYINMTLGLFIMPYQYNTGVQIDPSGWNGADNSDYNVTTGRLSFGEGGVDDAEDSDIIHHELAHGLHDWVTNGQLSQIEGLSEGVGDYWAASYNRSRDTWTPSDPQYYHVFRWDGHNEFWSGRTVNYRPASPAYPGGLVNNDIKIDGQIWATCMMDVWDGLGKEKTDAIFWEGLGMTISTTSQNDAANAVFQAAIDMGYTQDELIAVHDPLAACGYTIPDVRDSNCTSSNDIVLSGALAIDQSYITRTSITSNQRISGGADVLYQAGVEENLINPFEVATGAILTMKIEDCNNVSGN